MKTIVFEPKANLKRYVKMVERFECQAGEHDTLSTFLHNTPIPEEAVMGFFKNGSLLDRDYVPSNGEVVELYPVIDGG
ncbi:MAG: hypothetical protein QGH40_06700 [bacterium]|jgi:hypothetical protein|nr:hypothetical protein [bacterium]